jgi:hypothetical protein
MVKQFHQKTTKQTTTSHLKSLIIKNTTTYFFENPWSDLGQAEKKCDGVEPDNRIPTLPF